MLPSTTFAYTPQATLHEVWRVEIHSRMSADVHSFLGQSVPVELSVKGDRFVRRVVCYSSSPTAISFDDGGKLKIPAGESTAHCARAHDT